MQRPSLVAWVLTLSTGLLGAPRFAAGEDPKPPVKPAPKLATDAEATAAVEKFKTDFKAKGLEGEDKTSQRDFAMAQVSKVQHRLVVDQLAGVTKNPDKILRTLAVIYLAEQGALPGAAGGAATLAMQKNADDSVLLMSGLQTVGRLKYVGARDEIKALLKDTNYALRKYAIAAVGDTGDFRLLEDMLATIGCSLAADAKDPEGKKEATEGYSWPGASASVDTGSSGDSDQKAAEAQAKAQMAANKAAAEAGHKGGGPGEGEGSIGGGGAQRTPKELIPAVIRALKQLTGETFDGPPAVRKWVKAHADEIVEKKKALDATEKEQRAQATSKG